MPPNKDQTKAIKTIDSLVTGNNTLLRNMLERQVRIEKQLDFLLSREYLSEFEYNPETKTSEHRRRLNFEQWKRGHCVR